MAAGIKYLNLGCGYHYANTPQWINIDFIATGKGVLAHNLVNGIPLEDASVDLVYHSHVLEHFTKQAGERFMAECFRVLKPGGVIRVVVPDLEMIARNYLAALEDGLKDNSDEIKKANYDWSLLEMYDQTVRNYSGGEMANYLCKKTIVNEELVFDRIGDEGRQIRKNYLVSLSDRENLESIQRTDVYKNLITRLRKWTKQMLLTRLGVSEKALSIGNFRKSGEVHQWMYDRYSLENLLVKCGGKHVECKSAFSSYLLTWNQYELDGKEGQIRKPDSLFMEAIK